jgi:hypothetical protein
MNDNKETKSKDGDNAAPDKLPENPLTVDACPWLKQPKKDPSDLAPHKDPVIEALSWDGKVRAARKQRRLSKAWVTDIK